MFLTVKNNYIHSYAKKQFIVGNEKEVLENWNENGGMEMGLKHVVWVSDYIN